MIRVTPSLRRDGRELLREGLLRAVPDSVPAEGLPREGEKVAEERALSPPKTLITHSGLRMGFA